MGKVAAEANNHKRKKKGRPSLLDLQKRSLKLQQNSQFSPAPNFTKTPNSPPIPTLNSSDPALRSARRNPSSDGIDDFDGGDDDDDDDERKEKKLKLVVKLPSSNLPRSSLNSLPSAYDSNLEASKRNWKINAAVGDRSVKVEKVGKATDTPHGTRLESGPTTPLPDKKLLLFILDRLQKKDTYGVYSEPVDPKELPDYHDIIKHPMDFGTVRKKLDGGVYSSLEAFEEDVLLISSNALQYNSPDTIYFRQARSIQELARKDFENLRRESDDSDSQPKVVRRGRPPTKHLKKPISGSPAERAGPESSSGATLASGEDNLGTNSYNLRKVPTPSKLRVADTLVRASSHRSRNNTEAYSVCSEGKNDFSVSFLKGATVKNGKKQFILDENRRDTYNQCLLPSGSGYESPVLNALDEEVKQLTVVGLHMKHGYARSLARFAANLGPVAWKIASKKIETVLPAGLEFGPGWVQDNEGSQQDQSWSRVRQKPPLDSVCDDVSPSGPPPPASTSCSNSVPTDSRPSGHGNENLGEGRGLKPQCNSSSFNSIIGGLTPAAPFKIHKNSVIGPEMNDCSAAFGFSFPVPTAMTSAAVNSISGGSLVPPQALGMPSGSSNTFSSVPARQLDSGGTSSSGGLSRMPAENVCGSSFGHSADAPEMMGLYGKPSWQVCSPHHKKDSLPIPPDLNVRFQTAATPPPNSTLQIGSPQQPDLALQL